MEVTQPDRSVDACACECECACQHTCSPDVCVRARQPRSRMCSASQGHGSHTVTVLQAHPSIDLASPPSIHVLKHITEMTASDVPLPPPALQAPYCTAHAAGGRAYHGHNEKHKYTCTNTRTQTHEGRFHAMVFCSNISILWSYVHCSAERILWSLFH